MELGITIEWAASGLQETLCQPAESPDPAPGLEEGRLGSVSSLEPSRARLPPEGISDPTLFSVRRGELMGSSL